jgi:hypothetical protein
MRFAWDWLAAAISCLAWAILLPAWAPESQAANGKSSASLKSGLRVREARRPPALWRAEVPGDFQTSTEAARADALSKAAAELSRYLKDQYPGLRYQPTPQFLATHQMVDNPPFEEGAVEQFQDAPTLYRQKVTVELRPENLRPIFEEDRLLRSRERLEWAARIFGGVLIGLAALVGYLRLDDWTKGYFSAVLFIVIVAVTLIGIALWWFWF